MVVVVVKHGDSHLEAKVVTIDTWGVMVALNEESKDGEFPKGKRREEKKRW